MKNSKSFVSVFYVNSYSPPADIVAMHRNNARICMLFHVAFIMVII